MFKFFNITRRKLSYSQAPNIKEIMLEPITEEQNETMTPAEKEKFNRPYIYEQEIIAPVNKIK